MTKYFVCDSAVMVAATPPSVADVMRMAEATNDRCEFWHDDRRKMLVVEAENKPEDSEVFGAKWEELDADNQLRLDDAGGQGPA